MSTIRRQPTAFVQECKVCKDAGKPEALCRTHRVKDSTGKVICPTLLSQQCLKCGKKGHTVKFCTTIKAVVVAVLPPKKIDLANPVDNNSNKNTKKQSNNLFDLLDSEDDDFVAVKKTEKKKGNIDDFENNYPKLCTSMKKTLKEEVKTNLSSAPLQQQQSITKSYIDILAKPVSVSQDLPPIVKLPKISTQDSQENFVPFPKKMQEELQDMKLARTEEQLKRQLYNHDCFNGRNGLSWADAYDSDNDEYDTMDYHNGSWVDAYDSDNDDYYDEKGSNGYNSKILTSNAMQKLLV